MCVCVCQPIHWIYGFSRSLILVSASVPNFHIGRAPLVKSILNYFYLNRTHILYTVHILHTVYVVVQKWNFINNLKNTEQKELNHSRPRTVLISLSSSHLACTAKFSSKPSSFFLLSKSIREFLFQEKLVSECGILIYIFFLCYHVLNTREKKHSSHLSVEKEIYSLLDERINMTNRPGFVTPASFNLKITFR